MGELYLYLTYDTAQYNIYNTKAARKTKEYMILDRAKSEVRELLIQDWNLSFVVMGR